MGVVLRGRLAIWWNIVGIPPSPSPSWLWWCPRGRGSRCPPLLLWCAACSCRRWLLFWRDNGDFLSPRGASPTTGTGTFVMSVVIRCSWNDRGVIVGGGGANGSTGMIGGICRRTLRRRRPPHEASVGARLNHDTGSRVAFGHRCCRRALYRNPFPHRLQLLLLLRWSPLCCSSSDNTRHSGGWLTHHLGPKQPQLGLEIRQLSLLREEEVPRRGVQRPQIKVELLPFLP